MRLSHSHRQCSFGKFLRQSIYIMRSIAFVHISRFPLLPTALLDFSLLRMLARKIAFIAGAVGVCLVAASCGVDSKHFKLSGRLLNMNQGEFYIYSDAGGIDGIDTIKVQGGRFSYKLECRQPMTLTMVFPNFSEVPVFAQPGKTVDLSGDASNLKMMKVKGTKDNELMSAFREQIAHASPPEIKRYAAQFVADHPDSPVSEYIVKHFFVATASPDYKEARRLVSLMLADAEDNGGALRLQREVQAANHSGVGATLSAAGLTDIQGKSIAQSTLASGDVVIVSWASWSFDSTNQLRQIRDLCRQSKKRLKLITVCLDASRRDCENYIKADSGQWTHIFDGKMFEGRAVKQWGLYAVPTVLLLKNGRVVARDITVDDLRKRLNIS